MTIEMDFATEMTLYRLAIMGNPVTVKCLSDHEVTGILTVKNNVWQVTADNADDFWVFRQSEVKSIDVHQQTITLHGS